MPDVAFVSFDRLHQGDARKKSVATWVPDLIIEILSKSNSKKEIDRKLTEYFGAGVLLVWIVGPRKKTIKVYSDVHTATLLNSMIRLTVDGGQILPGFAMSIRHLLAKIE
ncbi:Uma2 family endonuclease [Schlesneria paludicola]|uniref:Uma2 family endonuclease n=1 Tax=Schlesneria paludicola TaxID=360056 RepID=UPI000682F7FA|nr:Uma2 family endonuclease [Schlesneria paludicola]